MLVDYLVLADGAKADVDKHHMLGAGWDMLVANDATYRLSQMAVAARVRFEDRDASPTNVALDLRTDSGESILDCPLDGRIWPQLQSRGLGGLPVRAYLAFTIADVKFPGPGRYHAVLESDSIELGRETFQVVDAEHLRHRSSALGDTDTQESDAAGDWVAPEAVISDAVASADLRAWQQR